MVGVLREQKADFANLCSWYLYDVLRDFFGFWALKRIHGLHYRVDREGVRIMSLNDGNNATLRDNYLGYGFTYAFRRDAATGVRFTDVNWGEDMAFVRELAREGAVVSIEDTSGLVLHVLHQASTSACFPQYHLPSFMMQSLFPAASAFLGQFRPRTNIAPR